ncbi:MAG: dipeptide epimerase [Pirellulaceae bacterium]|nr:dipeptide epimerase [Planctomycetales bacterium]
MKLELHKFDLPLRHTFTISRGSVDVQETLIVALHDGQYCGYGEATTNSYYSATIESMSSALHGLAAMLADWQFTTPDELWTAASVPLADNPFALCALDQAAHDLWGKRAQAPVYRLWGLDTNCVPHSNFTIGIDTVEKMVRKLQEVPDWPIYKIKLGTDHDLQIIRELRKHTNAVFRVDANCAWTADETISNSYLLRDLNVEFIEQPLKAEHWQEMRRVRAESALPVIADESCIVEADVDRCDGLFHGVNIKLVKCGGMTPARRMITRARKLDMKVMIGCMTESTVGISAIAQLLPLLDYVDMDGAALLARDIATGAKVERGRCIYAPENGNGVQLLT